MTASGLGRPPGWPPGALCCLVTHQGRKWHGRLRRSPHAVTGRAGEPGSEYQTSQEPSFDGAAVSLATCWSLRPADRSIPLLSPRKRVQGVLAVDGRPLDRCHALKWPPQNHSRTPLPTRPRTSDRSQHASAVQGRGGRETAA